MLAAAREKGSVSHSDCVRIIKRWPCTSSYDHNVEKQCAVRLYPVGSRERRGSYFGMVMDLPCRDPQIFEETKKHPYVARLSADSTQTFGEDWHSSSIIFTAISLHKASESSFIDQRHLAGVIMIMDVEAESTGGFSKVWKTRIA